MIAHEIRIPYLDGQIFRIKPGADWHLGHKYCDLKSLKRYLADGYDDPNCFLVTNGDTADAIVVPDKRYSKGSDNTETMAILDEQVEMQYDLVKPYRGRILGYGMGNHEDTVLKRCGTHMSRRLATMLDTTSLGYQWAITLRFYHKRGKGKVRTLVLFGQHGWGGGSRTEGGSITKYSNHSLRYEADIFFYGHDHQLKQNTVDFMGIRGKKFVPRAKRIYFPGTFKRTFSQTDEPTWDETRGFNPVTLTGVNIFVKPTNAWFDLWSDL